MVVNQNILLPFAILLMFMIQAESISQQTLLMLKGLRWKHLDVVHSENNLQELKAWMTFGRKNNVTVRSWINQTQFHTSVCSKKTPFQAVFVIANNQFENLATCMAKRRSYNSLMIVKHNVNISKLNSFLTRVRENVAFYLMPEQNQPPKLVFTNKYEQRIAVNDIDIVEHSSGHVDLDIRYNLTGLMAASVSLDWLPWRVHLDCDEQGQNCQHCPGVISDFTDTITDMFNLTFTCHKERINDWGITPKTGSWMDKNATFGGALGGVINEDYEFSASGWIHTSERQDWADFHFGLVETPLVMVFNMADPPIDILILMRGFRAETWTAIGFFVSIGAVWFGFLHYLDVREFKIENATNISSTSFWLLFVVVHSFYAGILTSFFIGTNELPFMSLRDGLLEYPAWKLEIVQGNEVMINSQVGSDPVFAQYWKYLEENPKDFIKNSLAEALVGLKEPGRFLIHDHQNLVSTILANPSLMDGLNLELFQVESTSTSVVLNKHSPYTRLFNRANMALKESGKIKSIVNKWVGKMPKNQPKDAEVLSLASLLLPFSLIFSVAVLVLFLLLAEMFKSWLTKNQINK